MGVVRKTSGAGKQKIERLITLPPAPRKLSKLDQALIKLIRERLDGSCGAIVLDNYGVMLGKALAALQARGDVAVSILVCRADLESHIAEALDNDPPDEFLYPELYEGGGE